MNKLTFSSPDLYSFCQLNNLGLTATGQHLCVERAIIECRFTKAPEPCPKCGAAGPMFQPKHEPTGFEITYKSECLGERNAKTNDYC